MIFSVDEDDLVKRVRKRKIRGKFEEEKERSYTAGKSCSFYIKQRVSDSKQFFIYRSFN